MNARHWFLVIVLLFVPYVPHSCFSQGTGVTVRGKVYKESPGIETYPLADVSVRLLSGEGVNHSVVGTGFTDSAGFYYIPNVQPGRYILQFYLSRVFLQQYGIVVPSDPADLKISPEDPSIRIFDVGPIYLKNPARF
jgi:hypothetical protein